MARCRRTVSGKFVGSAIAAGLVLAALSGQHGHGALGTLTDAHVKGGTLNCSQLEALWESAGGSPSNAFMAAEVAMAESGGDQYASSPAGDVGYWQINQPIWGSTLATTDPIGNAKAAIQISHDGADWTPWVTYDNGLENGKC